MARSLYGKLAAVLLVLFCLIGILYIALTLTTTRMYQQEVNQKLNRSLAANLVADQLLTSQGEVSPYALQELFHLLMVVNPSIEMYLIHTDGTIQAFSAAAGKVKRSRIDLGPVHRFLEEASALPILGDDPRDMQRSKVFSAAPIPPHGEPTGYLYIVLGGEEYDSAADMLQGSYIVRLSVWTGLTGLLFALLAGLLLFNVMTRRIRQLASSMGTFASSGFAAPLPVAHGSPSGDGDEIDRLKATFCTMAGRMLDKMNALKRTDASRRELVANVSHDLRTPLATLHGYLETLLIKEGRLTAAEQRSFLDVALRQSERLRRRVEELFELAKLDSNYDQVDRELFSLAELVQDVSQKFTLLADGKGIALHTRLQKDVPFVQADIALIERALENLLQNALRFTPDHGTITIALTYDATAVTVQVQDTGCGIPSEHLPHIFDRFYRADPERRGDGAGLGLAITKRIVELHGGTIEATSTPTVGTSISFRLPIHS
jgi:two-component system, OmpR family, sensor kinase